MIEFEYFRVIYYIQGFLQPVDRHLQSNLTAKKIAPEC